MPRTAAKAKQDADPFTGGGNGGSPVESKSDKFRRIAKKRVSRILKDAELLGNLSSPSYSFTEEEVGKVFSAIRENFDRSEAGFIRALSRGHKAVAGFDF